MFLRFPPQFGQTVVSMEVAAGAGFTAAADGTGPAGRRPGEHFLQATRSMFATGPQRRRRRGQRCRRAADNLVAKERRRELGSQMGREEEGRRRLDRPEAGAYTCSAENFTRNKYQVNINIACKVYKINVETEIE